MGSAEYVFVCMGLAVFLNLVLSYGANEFATEEERNPPSGAENLNFKSQLMHMLVHHSQVPISSSLIVAAVVALSVIGACYMVDDKSSKESKKSKK